MVHFVLQNFLCPPNPAKNGMLRLEILPSKHCLLILAIWVIHIASMGVPQISPSPYVKPSYISIDKTAFDSVGFATTHPKMETATARRASLSYRHAHDRRRP